MHHHDERADPEVVAAQESVIDRVIRLFADCLGPPCSQWPAAGRLSDRLPADSGVRWLPDANGVTPK